MKHEIDHLLKDALSYKEEPDDRLNQRIIKTVQQKERAHMDKNSNRIRVPAAALLAALVIFAGSATVYAAWKYLTPDQVAEVAEDLKLAEAFRGEDAVAVNEVQECGKYRITLLGIVSGKNLSQYISTDYAGNLQDNRTYVVTAIENADGTKRPDTSDDDYGKAADSGIESQRLQYYNHEWVIFRDGRGWYSIGLQSVIMWKCLQIARYISVLVMETSII